MSRTDANPIAKLTSLPERGGKLALFGPAPLIEGEDVGAYDELLTGISSTVKSRLTFSRRSGFETSSTSSGKGSACAASR
jgi:hypothetical protein